MCIVLAPVISSTVVHESEPGVRDLVWLLQTSSILPPTHDLINCFSIKK